MLTRVGIPQVDGPVTTVRGPDTNPRCDCGAIRTEHDAQDPTPMS